MKNTTVSLTAPFPPFLRYKKKTAKSPDPINSVFSSASNLGVVSEALDDMVAKYYNQVHVPQTPTTHVLTKQEVSTVVHMKALNSIVNPGEAVGALCAHVKRSLLWWMDR